MSQGKRWQVRARKVGTEHRAPDSAHRWLLSCSCLPHPWGCLRRQRLAGPLLVPPSRAMTPSNEVALPTAVPVPGVIMRGSSKLGKTRSGSPGRSGQPAGMKGEEEECRTEAAADSCVNGGGRFGVVLSGEGAFQLRLHFSRGGPGE